MLLGCHTQVGVLENPDSFWTFLHFQTRKVQSLKTETATCWSVQLPRFKLRKWGGENRQKGVFFSYFWGHPKATNKPWSKRFDIREILWTRVTTISRAEPCHPEEGLCVLVQPYKRERWQLLEQSRTNGSMKLCKYVCWVWCREVLWLSDKSFDTLRRQAGFTISLHPRNEPHVQWLR